MIKEAENFKTVETVRERERELQFSEISFIFDAKNHLNNTEILNIVNNIKRIGYVEEIKRFLLQNSLSFLWDLTFRQKIFDKKVRNKLVKIGHN